MKKIYLILGNKPFEEKLTEQLSWNFKLIGRADFVSVETGDDVLGRGADVLIVRESLAESAQHFVEFLRRVREANHSIKVITILHQHDVGDELICQIVSLGIFDIINGGTKLSDVISMATRESSFDDVEHMLNDDQKSRLSALLVEAANQQETVDILEEDVVIELFGELDASTVAKTGFKERYMSGITQVYSVYEQEEGQPEAPEITSVEDLPGYSSFKQITEINTEINSAEMSAEALGETTNVDNLDVDNQESEEEHELLSIPRSCKSVADDAEKVAVEAPAIAKKETKRIIHFVSHCLMSSVALQYAVSVSDSASVLYIETDKRNSTLVDSCKKRGVDIRLAEVAEDAVLFFNEVLGCEYDVVILNTNNPAHILLECQELLYELLQDKESALTASSRLYSCPNARIVFSYFDQDLPSIKGLGRIIGIKGIKWINTRVEEYNSRLNSKILSNDAVSEYSREV